MPRLTFSRILADRARADPDLPLVVDARGSLAARDLDRAASHLAHALIGHGVRPDDTVAVSLPNGRDMVIACAGIWRAGATPLPLDRDLTPPERRELESLARPVAAIGARPASDGIAWLPGVHVAADDRPLPDLAAACWKAVPTSGSTGRPKIVRAAAPALLDPDRPVAAFLPRRATQLVAGPMRHSAVLTYAFRGLLTGHRLVIMDRFDAARWIDLVQEHQVTWGLLVPTMMARLLRLPAEAREPARVASIERVLHMGAPCRADLKRAFLAWLGPERVDEVYAGSESNGLTCISGSEWLQHPGSVGRGIGGTVVRIRDEHGADLPAGAPGQVWMRRGDAPAYAYVGADSRRDAEGWDTLGDIGHLDEDGYLHLHDRADDMITRGGERIAPAAIEALLEADPDVLESAVYGVPDEDLGQAVHAVVRPADPREDPAAILTRTARRLGRRAPDALHVSTAPLRDEAGKIRRSALAAAPAPRDLPRPPRRRSPERFMNIDVPVVDIQVADQSPEAWTKLPIPELSTELDALPLVSDPDTGMSVQKVIYRAGHTTTWHTHPHAHGMFVLEGTLVTHQGDIGPGGFVWFPEGGRMQHGARPDEDVTFLFITNRPFEIAFCDAPGEA